MRLSPAIAEALKGLGIHNPESVDTDSLKRIASALAAEERKSLQLSQALDAHADSLLVAQSGTEVTWTKAAKAATQAWTLDAALAEGEQRLREGELPQTLLTKKGKERPNPARLAFAKAKGAAILKELIGK